MNRAASISAPNQCVSCQPKPLTPKNRHQKRGRGRPKKPITEVKHPHKKVVQFKKKLIEQYGSEVEALNLVDCLQQETCSSQSQLYCELGKSVCQSILSLPGTSPFWRPLLQATLQHTNLPQKAIQQVLPFHRNTISKSLNQPLKDNVLFNVKYKPNVNREVVSEEERAKYQELLLEACPVKSGENRYLKDPVTGN